MAEKTIAELEKLLNDAGGALPKVSGKKMFGCHALWADANVFGLVWKHGRIGFKLPEDASYEKLLALPGAEPWKAGPMKMAHWVLVPEALHSRPAELKRWATLAHGQCLKLEKKSKKTAAAKKKVASKKRS